jgi:hypothetical protein
MQRLEVSGAVRHIYIYVIRRLKVKYNNKKVCLTGKDHFVETSTTAAKLQVMINGTPCRCIQNNVNVNLVLFI